MMLTRPSKLLTPTRLAGLAIFVFATAWQGAFAQERSDRPKATGNRVTAKRGEKKSQPVTRPKKGAAVPAQVADRIARRLLWAPTVTGVNG